MIDNQPEEPDTSQPAAEDLIERLDRLFDEFQRGKRGAQRKLEPDDKSANQPDPKKEE